MDATATLGFVQRTWDAEIVPALSEYVTIPAKSPHFDAEWKGHGHLDRAVGLIEAWCKARPIEGLRVEVVRLPERTPLIYMEVPGRGDTVLLYGHLDKQPEMVGWSEGLGPWTPVRRGDKLYGRGAGDDGYAAFAALTAIQALQQQRTPHARCVVLIEACEESGSYDLPAYLELLAPEVADGDQQRHRGRGDDHDAEEHAEGVDAHHLERHAQRLGADLGEHRLQPLPEVDAGERDHEVPDRGGVHQRLRRVAAEVHAGRVVDGGDAAPVQQRHDRISFSSGASEWPTSDAAAWIVSISVASSTVLRYGRSSPLR